MAASRTASRQQPSPMCSVGQSRERDNLLKHLRLVKQAMCRAARPAILPNCFQLVVPPSRATGACCARLGSYANADRCSCAFTRSIRRRCVNSIAGSTRSCVLDRCRLLLHHTVPSTLPFPRERELTDDHWRCVFGNLSAHLVGGSGISLPDFSDPDPEVRQVIMIEAPRDVVFRSLITPRLVNTWFGSKAAVIEPHEGGRYEVGWKYKVHGRDVHATPSPQAARLTQANETVGRIEHRRDARRLPASHGDVNTELVIGAFQLYGLRMLDAQRHKGESGRRMLRRVR